MRKNLLTKMILSSLVTISVIGSQALAADALTTLDNVYMEVRNSSPDNTILIGKGASQGGHGTDSIAIGTNGTVANNVHSIAIGYNAQSGDNKSEMNNTIAIGTTTKAESQSSIAIGHGAYAKGNRSVAIGVSSQAGYYGVAIGRKTTVRDGGVAMADGANAQGKNGIALGAGSQASLYESVALGAHSSTTKGVVTKEATVNGITYGNFAGDPSKTGDYVVSVGNDKIQRQIQNVAAGQINETSTDAINGSQLYATNNVIGNVASGVAKVLSGDNKNITVNPQTGEVEYTGTQGLAGTKATNFEDAIKAARTTVDSSTKTISVKENEKDGALTYDINVNKGTLTVGDDGKVTAGVAKETTDINPNATADNSFTTAKDVAEAINDFGNGKANVDLDNLSTKGQDVISNAAKEAVQPELNNKANTDASNLTDENVTKWQEKLGNGTVTDGNAGLVTGDTVFEAIKDKADTSLTNLTEDGQNVVRDLAKDAVKPEINRLDRKVNKLDNKVNKVGAGAAALAALHPLDFNPDDKWSFAAGYGNYSNANAMAVGAYYRPNENTMFSVAGTMGNGENMVNAGVAFKVGSGNEVSQSRVAMAKEIADLKAMVATLAQRLDSQDGQSTTMHQNDRFRVDRVAGNDNDRYKIERVRVNNTDVPEQNEYRDVYGNEIAAPVVVKEEVPQNHIVDLWAAINK